MRWIVRVGVAVALLVGCGGGEPEAQSSPEPDPDVSVLPSTGHDTPSESARITVVFTNNIDGEIEPCG
jgi:hypothetical protein